MCPRRKGARSSGHHGSDVDFPTCCTRIWIMKHRAIKDLGQLSDPDFFRAVSEGLSLVIKNATRLHDAAQTLHDAKHAQGTHVLTLLAEEEAAKFLILIDAVRCPLRLAKIRTRQLRYFHNHLARGIYARLVKFHRRVRLAGLERIADSDRESLFLDGPNDVDWIFRNTILARREEAIYVDYVETVDGHEWLARSIHEWAGLRGPGTFLGVSAWAAVARCRAMAG